MKNLSKIALVAFAAASFTFVSCESKPAGETTTTEETTATDGTMGTDSAATSADTTGTTTDTAAAGM